MAAMKNLLLVFNLIAHISPQTTFINSQAPKK